MVTCLNALLGGRAVTYGALVTAVPDRCGVTVHPMVGRSNG